MLLERLSPEDMAEVSAIFESSGKLGYKLLKKIYELTRKWQERSASKSTPETGAAQKDAGLRQELRQYSQENPFVFRGTNQDMSWFWSRQSLPVSRFNELQEPMREQVVRNFGELQRQGLVNFDGQALTLTEAGSRYIHDVGYISDVLKADQELNQQIQGLCNQAAGAPRFQPAGRAVAQAGTTAAQTGGTAVQAGAAAAQTGHAAVQAGNTAAQAGKAVGTAATTAGTAASAAATAGITLAAQAAQEVVTGLNKAVNTLLTHK